MDKEIEPISEKFNQSERTTSGVGEIEEIEDEVGTQFKRFKNFEVESSSPSDHHYIMDTQYLCTKLMHMHTLRKRMEEEYCVLEMHTPPSIYVRAYQHRIDLMRAAFFGPPGSDYQHCLFFFDICFPVNYPRVPPNLYYLSYGIDWNPNLRPSGKVGLDLGETWHRRLKQILPGNSKKGKREFNVLQMLYAIQNLISYRSGSSEKHNTKAFSRACEKMTRLLRKPPAGFEYFVAGHFRQRAHPVLLIFKEHDYEDETMIDLFIRMFTVFERNGAYCKHHLDFLKSRRLPNQGIRNLLTAINKQR